MVDGAGETDPPPTLSLDETTSARVAAIDAVIQICDAFSKNRKAIHSNIKKQKQTLSHLDEAVHHE
jgi:hypothetical protein